MQKPPESKLNIKRHHHNSCYFIDIVSFSMRINVTLFRITIKSQTTKLYLNQLYKAMPCNKLLFEHIVAAVRTKQKDKWRHQTSQSNKWKCVSIKHEMLSYESKTNRMICLLFDCHASDFKLMKTASFAEWEISVFEENSIWVLNWWRKFHMSFEFVKKIHYWEWEFHSVW